MRIRVKVLWLLAMNLFVFMVSTKTVFAQTQAKNEPAGVPWDFAFTQEALIEDYHQMTAALEQMHPALHRFCSPDDFEAVIQEQLGKIQGPMPLLSYYKLVSSVFVKVGCGHSIVVIPRSFRANRPNRFFPVGLKFLNSAVLIEHAYGRQSAIPVGSQLISVNGSPLSEIIESLASSCIPSDGDRYPYKRAQLNSNFLFYAMLQFGFPERYEIVFLPPGGGAKQSVVLGAIGIDEVRAFMAACNPSSGDEDGNLGFKVLQGKKSAVITLKSFSYYSDEGRQHFFAFIEDAFRQIKGASIGHVILDLRGNTGGDPYCANHLLSFLMDKPFQYFSERYEDYEVLGGVTELAADRFAGKLCILIDGAGFSTTGHACALLKYHGRGVFIGEETGATYTCNDGTEVVPLKNTKLDLYIATHSFAVAVEGLSAHEGIRPDYPVSCSLEDWCQGVDPVMQKALALIEKES